MNAELDLQGHRPSVSDYWQLVFAARRHMRDCRYWVILSSPLALQGVGELVHAVEVIDPDAMVPGGESVNYLGEDLTTIASPALLSFGRSELSEAFFRRGDLNGDGRVNL